MNLTSASEHVNGIALHYYRSGGAKPPLILIHGLSDDGLCWLRVAEVLAQNYDLVMVDMRGHGKSEAPVDGYTLCNLATDVAGLSQKLRLDKPVLMGHSMGAITSLVLAGLFPDLPRAILLEDPPAFWCFDEANMPGDPAHNGLLGWLESIKRKSYSELIDECRTNSPTWSEAELPAWVDSKHHCSPRISALVTPEDILTLDLPRTLARITCPALIISADLERGAIASPEHIQRLRACIPHLEHHHIANAGHNIRREQFTEYMQVIQDRLARLEA